MPFFLRPSVGIWSHFWTKPLFKFFTFLFACFNLTGTPIVRLTDGIGNSKKQSVYSASHLLHRLQ